MSPTQIKPRPEIYRLAAELIDSGKVRFSGPAILAATEKIMVKCSTERRRRIAKMHCNQIAAMTGRTAVALEHLAKMGNLTDAAYIAKEAPIHNRYWDGVTVGQLMNQRVTALLLMADIVESPNN
jgi:hypothetical protein